MCVFNFGTSGSNDPYPSLCRWFLHSSTMSVQHARGPREALHSGVGRSLLSSDGHLPQVGGAHHRRSLLQHQGRVGDREKFHFTQEETRSRSVWRSVGRSVEQHNSGGRQDAKAGLHGHSRLPRRSADHEEASTRETHPALRRVHKGRTGLHCH